MNPKDLRRAVQATFLLGFSLAPLAAGGVIYGPTYNSSTGTGYSSPFLDVPDATAASGFGIGSFGKSVNGVGKGGRGLRWDSSGAVTELANLGTNVQGVTSVWALAVSKSGTTIAGAAEKYVGNTSKGEHAVRWDAAGNVTELGDIGTDANGGTGSEARAINAAGTATGYANKFVSGTNKGIRAVRWDASGTAIELGNLGTTSSGNTSTEGSAINSAGTIVGYGDKYVAGNWQANVAMRWDPSGTAATELGNLGTDAAGSTHTYAYGINDAGTAVGYCYKYVSGTYLGFRATRWDASGTAATEMGNLGTSSTGMTTSFARHINSAGLSTGWAHKYVSGADKGTRAARWDALGVVTELGNLGTDSTGSTSSQAYDINDLGVVVGFAEKYDGSGNDLGSRAVVWGTDGLAIDLSSYADAGSGWLYLEKADGISNDNWITGTGRFDPDGAGPLAAYDRAFLLNASTLVPEPASLSLLALAGLALRRRRR